MIDHHTYMRRCLQLAKLGLGITRPNPMVGAVIVAKDRIIGEGFTSTYGGPHAEVNAIKSVKDPSMLKEATLYVTLEPCSHFGKTPPCSDLIIKNQIPNVVIGCLDPSPEVSGAGLHKLRASGCQVTLGILEEECKLHHRRFLTYHTKKRPYIILKWAESKDGFMAPQFKDNIEPFWISNSLSRQLVHKWRSEEQAILVGKNTVVHDNPRLNIRNWTGTNPVRIVLDKNNELSKNLAIFNNDSETIVLKENTPNSIAKALYDLNINSVIIEGGRHTLKLFIDAGLWDEARIFIGDDFLKEGLEAPELNGRLDSEYSILDNQLIY